MQPSQHTSLRPRVIVLHECLVNSKFPESALVVAFQKKPAAVGKDARNQQLYFVQICLLYLHVSCIDLGFNSQPSLHPVVVPTPADENRSVRQTSRSRARNSSAGRQGWGTLRCQSLSRKVSVLRRAQKSLSRIRTMSSHPLRSCDTHRSSNLPFRPASESLGSI